MQDDLIFIFNVGVGLVPTLSAFRGQPQGIAPTISSQSHATPESVLIAKIYFRPEKKYLDKPSIETTRGKIVKKILH